MSAGAPPRCVSIRRLPGLGPGGRLACLAFVVVSFLAAIAGFDRAFPPPLERAESASLWVSDREGRPLRAFPTQQGRWRLPADLDGTDPAFIAALLEIEDRRFFSHGGVDWLALSRAAGRSALAGEVVSGGSTITMQLARLLEPRPRTVGSKLIEMVRAHQIEARLSKREILELYLTLAPYGGNLEGVRAASWRYFGHGPDRLSDDEIALLIALPQAPEGRRPDRRPDVAARARNRIADRLEGAGVFNPARASAARDASLPTTWHRFPELAWHASDEARRRARTGTGADVMTTLDAPLQRELEALAAEWVRDEALDVQASILVVDIPTRAVRAAVGSASRHRPGGWLDLTAQVRSPGSALKPYIYGLSFDDGLAGPGTRIADLPRRFAAYQPENFDRSFRGDVTLAEALQHSLNVPAVLTLAALGPERLAAEFALSGVVLRQGGGPDEAGLALALGGAGVTARDLAMLYAALGDQGRVRPLVWTQEALGAAEAAPAHVLLSGDSADSILRILREAPAPAGRVPGRLTRDGPAIAFKTGTSYGYRDAWAAGVAGDLALVVWVGRADGAPRPGETGRSAALPLLFQVADRAMQRLAGDRPARVAAHRPEADPPALARLDPEGEAPAILFPPHGAELWAGAVNGRNPRSFVLSGRGNGPLDWYVDGLPLARDDSGAPVWSPSASGFYKVMAVDRNGRSVSATVRVIGAPSG